MASLLPRKLRRLKAEQPYSYPLTFLLFDLFSSFVKNAAILGVLVVGFLFLKSLLATDGSTPGASQPAIAVSETRDSQLENIAAPLPQTAQLAKPDNQQALLRELPANLKPEASSAYTGKIRHEQEALAWIRQQYPTDFIIQFASTPDETAILEFAQQYLGDGAVVYPYKRTPTGRPIFGVASERVFASLDDAQNALKNFPSVLRNSDPWIRPINKLRRQITETL